MLSGVNVGNYYVVSQFHEVDLLWELSPLFFFYGAVHIKLAAFINLIKMNYYSIVPLKLASDIYISVKNEIIYQ